MAVHSMTGFGRGTALVGGAPYGIEIRAVNHRFLDAKIRLPRGLGALEPHIQRRVNAGVQRGRIDVSVSALAGDGGGPTGVVLNTALAEEYRRACAELAARLQLNDNTTTAQVAAFPGVLQPVLVEVDDAELLQAFVPAFDGALAALVQMRAEEGGRLAELVSGLLDAIDGHRAWLVTAAPGQVEAWRTRLLGRLTETLAGLDLTVDAGRVMHEVALFAERVDVTEELDRLGSHLTAARALVHAADAEPVGRRLDFLCQEMLREANTTGSKVQDVRLTERVIALKSDLDRLREQVQNIE